MIGDEVWILVFVWMAVVETVLLVIELYYRKKEYELKKKEIRLKEKSE